MARLFVLFAAVLLVAGPVDARPLRVAVIADLNGSYGSTDYAPEVAAAVTRILAIRPDLVISAGDVVAGQRRNPPLSAAEIDAMWSAFDEAVAAPLEAAGIPLIATPGNHDASAYSGFEAERVAYARVWGDLPDGLEMVDDAGWPFRYGVSLDDALFVSLDATTIGELPAEQMAWLEALLRRERDRRAVLVFGHLPIWPFAQGRETDIAGGAALAALFAEVGVDAYLSGHHHAYYSGVFDGVLYVAQGGLGGGARRLVGQNARSPKTITLLEISDDGSIAETALGGPDFLEAIPLEVLPEVIRAPWGDLVRRGLEH